jgi:hypothetical protein
MVTKKPHYSKQSGAIKRGGDRCLENLLKKGGWIKD